MDLNVKISVIIPAYNVAQWLCRCVDSVLAQTYGNLEILLIDDGSTDETPEIIDTYARKDSRVIAVHQANAGLVAVREKGIALATGEYVSFVDGDDVIEPDFLARLLANAIKYNADISHSGMKYCFYDGREKLHYGTGEVQVYDTTTGVNELLLGRKIEPSLCNKLYRRELLADSCLDVSVVNNEDLLRNFVLFRRANRSVFEDFCGYHYWRRAGSMSNSGFNAKACRHLLRARSLILENAGPSAADAARQAYISVLIGCYGSAIGTKTEGAKEIARHCRSELKQLRTAFSQLPKRLALQSSMILDMPILYYGVNIIRKLNIKRRVYMTRRKVQKECHQ